MKRVNEPYEKMPFRTPENYFDDLNSRILAATSGEEKLQEKESLMVRLRPFIAIAASIALLIMIGYEGYKVFSEKAQLAGMPEITLQEFSDSYLNDIDLLTLEENNNLAGNSDVRMELADSVIIDYLIRENIDENDIYELL